MSRFPRHGRPGATRPWWRRLRLLDVVVLTALPVAGALYVFWLSLAAYQHAVYFDDFWSRAVQMDQDYLARIRFILATPARVAAGRVLDSEAADPAIIRLLLPQDRWRILRESPWAGWDVWEDATLDRRGALEQVRIRKRGDNSIHWLTPKVSLTLRTSRETLINGYRSLGLSTKDVLTQYVTNHLPRDVGLLAPRTDLAPVFVNRRFYGLFRAIEGVDESMLRGAGRMPGNIFRADAAERGEYFKALPRNVFQNAAIWDRVSFNDRPSGPSPAALPLFLEDLNGSTFADHQRLMAWVDRAEIARLLAVLLIVGDPLHMDDVHNQYWYEDPATGLLHPIPWDLRLLPLDRPGLPVNMFWRKALRDPFLVDATLREVRSLLDDENLIAHADTLAREAHRRFKPYFDFESLREGLIIPLGHPDTIRAMLEANARVLHAWIDDTEVGLAVGTNHAGLRVLDIESRGMAGVDLVGLRVDGVGGAPSLREDRNDNGTIDPEDPSVSGQWARDGTSWSFVPNEPIALLPGWNTDGKGIAVGRVAYRFFLQGTTGRVTPQFRRRLGGAPVTPSVLQEGGVLPATSSFSPWRFPRRAGRTINWSGAVRLSESVMLERDDTLRIAPGTTIRMGPEVSVVSRGPVYSLGTSDRPIRFLRGDPARPWGTVALQGDGAGGSRFRHVEFVGGGGALIGRIEYIGAVNVHGARDVSFERSLFADNVRSDDMLHILDAQVDVRQSTIRGANSDGIDMDNSSGWLVDNVIEASRGDGIDLMASTPVIAGNRIVGSGDKAVSIGEASAPILVGNDLIGGSRGAEVKDGSEPLFVGNRIATNQTGLRLDRKNWRYGRGGEARILATIVEENTVALESDSNSRMTFASDETPSDFQDALSATAGIRWLGGIGPGSWTAVPLVPPRFEELFSEGFNALGPWMFSGGGERINRRDGVLSLALRRSLSMLWRGIDWVVPQAGQLLVVEVGGRDLSSIEVSIVRSPGNAADTLRRSVTPLADPTHLQFVVLELPPGRYEELRISGLPYPRIERLQQNAGFLDEKGAHLFVRRVQVLERPVRAAAP